MDNNDDVFLQTNEPSTDSNALGIWTAVAAVVLILALVAVVLINIFTCNRRSKTEIKTPEDDVGLLMDD